MRTRARNCRVFSPRSRRKLWDYRVIDKLSPPPSSIACGVKGMHAVLHGAGELLIKRIHILAQIYFKQIVLKRQYATKEP